MGRRKQPKPQCSSGLNTEPGQVTDGKQVPGDVAECSRRRTKKNNVKVIDKPYYVNICPSEKQEKQHFDVAEVVLTNLSFRQGVCGNGSGLDCSLRFRICNVDRIKPGHWPQLSSSDVTLEMVEASASGSVVLSGGFDGPDEGVSALAHLVSVKFLTLRLVPGDEGSLSPRIRVELLQKAFDSCGSLLENTRHVWKRSIIHVMSWLRPEVMTSEARYGRQLMVREDETLDSSKQTSFDAGAFYEAIKPSKTEPMLDEDDITDLLPKLRPYQRRAAYWMVQRERGDPKTLGDISPLSIPIGFLDSASKMFFNPLSGNISLTPEYCSPRIPGGILADEMGLGKTVELLACILSHRKPDNELLQVTASPVSTGATLIVCPAPILLQWHSEITRHTRLGSLVTCIYEGVRNVSLSEEPMVDITELLNADIVLTTYDVLKEDLTHDGDRHDGDRHCLRFQKRSHDCSEMLERSCCMHRR